MLFKEILELITLIFRIAFAKVEDKVTVAKQFIEKAYKRYLRALIWCAILGTLIPLAIIVAGFLFGNSTLFAIAGFIMWLFLMAFMLSTKPLLIIVDVLTNLIRHKVLGQKETNSELAKRFTRSLETVMLCVLLFCTYMWLLDVQTNMGAFLYFLLATAFLVILVMKAPFLNKMVRFVSIVVMVFLFVLSIAKFSFPQTTEHFRHKLQNLDNVSQTEQSLDSADTQLLDDEFPSPDDVEKIFAARPGPDSLYAGWRALNVSAEIAEAIPTGVQIQRGDTLFVKARGRISYSFYPSDAFALAKLLKVGGEYHTIASGPNGMWPNWMTQASYAQFDERASGKCWNLIFRNRVGDVFGPAKNAGSSLAWVADSDGSIWLDINRFRSGDFKSDPEGLYQCAVRVGKLSARERAKFQKGIDDSLKSVERQRERDAWKQLREQRADKQRRIDSLKFVLDPFKIIEPTFLANPYDTSFVTISVPLGIVRVFPTGIPVAKGDTIFVSVAGYGGKVTLKDGSSAVKEIIVGPEGIWPEWMTPEQYLGSFRETESRKCWNLTLQNGMLNEAKQINVGQGIVAVAQYDGEVCFNINRMALPLNWSISVQGEYVAKVFVARL